MSGGSFNYLCHVDSSRLMERMDDLRDMAAELTTYGAHTAAAETEAIIAYLEHADRQINARQCRLVHIWKAMEWMRSGDWGREQFEKAIKDYQGA